MGGNVIDSEMTGIGRPARAERQNRKISSVCGRVEFERLATQWDRLILRMPGVRFFQHPDWYRALFDSELADPERFLFVILSDGPDLLGLFPLQIETLHKHGVSIRTLGLCNHAHMDLADCLIDDSCDGPGLIPSLVRWLHEGCPVAWDVLKLERIPQRSAFYRLLSAETASRAMPAVTGSSAHLSTESEAAAFGAVSGSFKYNLRRRAKQAEAAAPLRYTVYNTLPELDLAFPRFLEVEASGWKGARGSGTAIGHDSRLVNFYQGLMQRFGARGQCLIGQLTHGDTVVASQFGLLVGGTVSTLKIGYREDHAWFAPGNLAMERMIRWCCARPDVHELSFVTAPPWGHFWKPKRENVASFRIFSPTLKGRLLYHGLRTKRWYDQRRRRMDAVDRGAGPSTAGAPDKPESHSPDAPATPLHPMSSEKT